MAGLPSPCGEARGPTTPSLLKGQVARSKFRFSASTKITFNALLAHDAFQLKRLERKQIRNSPSFARTLTVPACCFGFRMIGRRPRSNIITFDRSQIQRKPLTEFDIFLFVDEVIKQGKPYQETTLYGKFLSGELRKPITRAFKSADDPTNRTKITSEEEFSRYYTRCLSLADSIAKHGLFDLKTDEGYARGLNFGHDFNILVAIDEDGGLIHWRMGKHRLAIARALGLQAVPVNVGFLSGHWMLAVAGRARLLMRNGLDESINLAFDEAQRRANAS